MATITPGAPGTEPGRRERRKLRTREALEAAALRLFAERGYDHTTVEDIAEEADVAVRTFFRYFSSKQHVLFGDVAHTIVDQLRAALGRRPADEPLLTAIDRALDDIGLENAEQQEQIRQRLVLLERQPNLIAPYLLLFHRLRAVIVEFVAARTGCPTTDLRLQLVAAATVGAIESAVGVWYAAAGTSDLVTLRREAFTTLTAHLADPRHP